LEKYFIIRNQIKFYNNIEVGATYTVPRSLLKLSAENPLESVIHCALAETLNSQPILGVTIQDEQSPNPKWARVAEFDLREVVKFILEESPSNSVKWIQAGHHEPLDRIGELPLWRVVVALQTPAPTDSESSPFSFSMAFFCHHAIADGLSAGAFHLTFLDALNHLVGHSSDILYKPIIEVPKLPLVPNLEMTTHLRHYTTPTSAQYPHLLAPTYHDQQNRSALQRRANNRDCTCHNPHGSLARNHLLNAQTLLL
jgi:hypothetical protein